MSVFPVHVENQEQYIQFLEKFGDNCVVRDDAEVGSTFLKFAGFTKELTSLFKNLVRGRSSKFAHSLTSLSKMANSYLLLNGMYLNSLYVPCSRSLFINCATIKTGQ